MLSGLPEINKEPITDLTRMRSFIHKDAVYLFNPHNLCISAYVILQNGFSYSVTKYALIDVIKQMNFIWLSKGAKEITGEEFTEFVNQIGALQEQSHLIKPLTNFEDFVNSIITNYGLKVNYKLNGG